MIWNQSKFFRRYGPLLVLATLFGGLFGFWRAERRPPAYRSSATLQLPPGKRLGRGISKEELTAPRPEFMTELFIMKSDRLARRVISELNLAARADFLGFEPPAQPSAAAHEELVQSALLLLRRNFTVVVLPNTDLARLSYTSRDAALSAAVVNTFTDDFLEDRFERRLTGAGLSRQLMADRLTALHDEFTGDQMRLLVLQQELQTPGFSPRRNQIASRLAALATEERRARLAQLADQNRVSRLRSQAAAGAPVLTPPPLSAGTNGAVGTLDATAAEQERLLSALNQARAAQAQASGLLGPNHPSALAAAALVESYQQELDGQNAQILTAAEQRAAVDAGDRAGLHAEFERQLAEAQNLAPELQEYTTLERRYVFARALYYRFLTRLRASALAAGLGQANVYIVDRARVPVDALSANATADGLGGAIISLVFAWLLAVLLHYRGNLLVRVEHLERVTGLPALAILPKLQTLILEDYASGLAAMRPRTADAAEREIFVNGVFDLAGALAPPAHGEQARARSVLLTSSSPGEGKTSISSALAITLAHGGRRVLLIDGDLHRPQVARRLGLQNRTGLSSVVSGSGALEQAVQQAPGAPTLDVLVSGPMPPNPDRMLASCAMRGLLAEAARQYDVIVIDAPPVLAVQDALVLTQLADEVVWVMRDFNAKAWLTRRTRRLLEEVGAPVRGLVINGAVLPGRHRQRRARAAAAAAVSG